ncbi:CPBP family intramembrane glutamic endopeptidase [Nocardiopsis sp. MG754419]|uniref:CPBP family intramembrane glutamic endopeptidase n=1 Tax=Nocardiopsis sp. MG754419 TaxID=2259865 RepID=UPI001BAAFC89|nr:CPBP family intramembrane glutamic endopeptidase [Nocardiopsis sp. MG754419]MBR8740829.1 CPBP family intramembrane metalloprotease [Nocardiopsis sp. MG754419]
MTPNTHVEGSSPDHGTGSEQEDHVDSTRPFLAHLRMAWWRPILITCVLMAAMVVVPFGTAILASLIETAFSTDGEPPVGSTPLMVLMGNLALGAMVPLTLLVMRWIGKVPVRAGFTTGRPFSWPRMLRLMGLLFAPLCVIMLVIQGLAGFPPGGVVITGTTVVMLVIVVCTAPLQAAGEEVVFRGGIGPALGSWVRHPRAAAALALVVSSLLFGLVHFASDPWLSFYYTWLGFVFGTMALVTRGLEAPIALHAVNNVVALGSGVLLSGGGPLVVDRAASGGNESMIIVLVFVPTQVLIVGILYLAERRHTARGRGASPAPTR